MFLIILVLANLDLFVTRMNGTTLIMISSIDITLSEASGRPHSSRGHAVFGSMAQINRRI